MSYTGILGQFASRPGTFVLAAWPSAPTPVPFIVRQHETADIYHAGRAIISQRAIQPPGQYRRHVYVCSGIDAPPHNGCVVAIWTPESAPALTVPCPYIPRWSDEAVQTDPRTDEDASQGAWAEWSDTTPGRADESGTTPAWVLEEATSVQLVDETTEVGSKVSDEDTAGTRVDDAQSVPTLADESQTSIPREVESGEQAGRADEETSVPGKADECR